MKSMDANGSTGTLAKSERADYSAGNNGAGRKERKGRSHAGRNSICEQGCGETNLGTAGLQAELLPMEEIYRAAGS